jgi:endonuclease/exonuclease/phosphatase family metal-dependent hydrolase
MRAGLAWMLLAIAAVLSACASRTGGIAALPHADAARETCQARSTLVRWLPVSRLDRHWLDTWCRGVGPPVVGGPSAAAEVPRLPDVAIVTWNAHLGHGRLIDLVADLRAGALTGGRPVHHFVLLVQELFRRGAGVPDFTGSARAAAAIPIDRDALDARSLAHTLGLSIVYVPSMRNGAERPEDRGSALLSTEPLFEPLAFELPFERQRRVAVGAFIHVRTERGIEPLRLMTVHLDPVSGSQSLWLFRNPRRRQAAAVLAALGSEPVAAGTVLGGDFNTIQAGAREAAYQHTRRWSTSLTDEDQRATHRMGRLDYLFFRLPSSWQARSRRLDHRYGSDHFPVLGRFVRALE